MWEEDEGRAPISPARVAQYEGCCVIVLDAEIRKSSTFISISCLAWMGQYTINIPCTISSQSNLNAITRSLALIHHGL
jgi:hypothetical protein